jgi:tripartite-type tricarboxylate transporter receptor subunit TctC
LHIEFAKAVQLPQMREFLERGGYVPLGSAQDEFKKFLANDLKTLAALFKLANIKPE